MPNVYTTSPFANDCMKVVEIIDSEIVDSMCKEYYANCERLQISPQYKSEAEARKAFRTMIRSLLCDDAVQDL